MLTRRLILFFATGGGVGFIPGPAGTYGTAVGVLLYAAIHGLSNGLYLLFLITFFFFSVWAAGLAEVYFGQVDSGKIVIDEILGYLATMAFIPFRWDYALAGFVAF